jgi:hypothetical protein
MPQSKTGKILGPKKRLKRYLHLHFSKDISGTGIINFECFCYELKIF